MLLAADLNEVSITGNIAQVNILNGQYGLFGSVSLALDDSYYDKKNNNERVVKTVFVEVVLQDSYFKKIKETTVGDRLSIQGKLILDQFKQNGTDRTILKVRCQKVISHTSKADRELLKQQGLLGQAITKNAPQQQSAPQQQGGYNQQSAPQQQGGYNQQSAPQQLSLIHI